jgi:hypothetical protein
MYDWVNHVRAASFTCVLFCTIVLAFSIYHPGVEWDDADGIKDYRQKVSHWGYAINKDGREESENTPGSRNYDAACQGA